MAHHPCSKAAALLVAVAAFNAFDGNQVQASPVESWTAADHGRRVYQHGLLRDGQELTAWVGPGARLPGALAACTRCHGVSGRGSRDAGLQIPALRWTNLMQDRPASAGLLARPAYTEATLLKALKDGIDPMGRPLAAAMPRFELSDRAAADLLQHLRRMGTPEDRHPGVEPDRVRVGTVVPTGSTSSPATQAHTAAARACLERANREGGVHGRQIELKVYESESALIERLPPWSEDVLLVVAPWWPQGSAARLSRQYGPLPVIGPLGAASELMGASEWWFGVVPVPSDQIRMAIDRAAMVVNKMAPTAESPSQARVVVLLEDGQHESLRRAAEQAAQAQAGLHVGLRVEVVTLPASPTVTPGSPGRQGSPSGANLDAIRTALRGPSPVGVVAALNGIALQTVAAEMQAQGLPPQVLLYGLAQQASAHPLGWAPTEQQRLRLISSSVAESDFNPRPFEADLAAIGAKSSMPSIQVPAYVAACAAVEALRRAGRDLDREQLLGGLVAIQRFTTGVMPPLSFGPRQRHGVWQSRVLKVGREGKSFEPESGWESPKVAL